ncbi:hypothetical protein [Brachybacterium sp. UNK5269]|uniref:hypothetical protein n=1 Tax=Brachybacterium sp. UNK5269 TaxID=3408576 RepID=UPI003BAFAE13
MMTTQSGSPLPHGFVVPPNDVVDDEAATSAATPDEQDDEAARAEALGLADPEDAPPSS